MENRNDRKSYYKGLLTGVILCVLIIGVLALSGCFLKDYAPSSDRSDHRNRKCCGGIGCVFIQW